MGQHSSQHQLPSTQQPTMWAAMRQQSRWVSQSKRQTHPGGHVDVVLMAASLRCYGYLQRGGWEWCWYAPSHDTEEKKAYNSHTRCLKRGQVAPRAALKWLLRAKRGAWCGGVGVSHQPVQVWGDRDKRGVRLKLSAVKHRKMLSPTAHKQNCLVLYKATLTGSTRNMQYVYLGADGVTAPEGTRICSQWVFLI